MLPPSGRRRPAIILTTLVFPEPLGPRRPNDWPGSSAKVTPSTAQGSRRRYRLRSASTRTTASMGQPNIHIGMFDLDDRQQRTLVWAGAAVVLAAFDGSVLILALPAIATDFHAQVPQLTNLGSVLAV